jgi:Kelch motif
MVLYKMLARDVNSNPTQYRTWIVANNPDLGAQFYYGYKSGSNAFVDISAYAINDSTVIADFNLPTPANWNPGPPEIIKDYPIFKVLPATCEDAAFAIIDGYAYLFGGNLTSHIYRASLNNPATWVDTGATLPTALYGASLAVVDGYIYLFGGNSGQVGFSAVSTIFSAPVSNPLEWTNTGATLPYKLQYSQLGMYDGYLYLFGGYETGAASNVILTAHTSNPTVWTDTGQHLPVPIYGSCLAQINDSWMLFGGNTAPNAPTAAIFSSTASNPTSWSLDGYLPYPTSFGQLITIGNDGYIIGPVVGQTSFTGFTPILQCHLDAPTTWFDTNQYVRGQISHSNIGIIYDRVWLFGGSGETAIFACNQQLKYNYYDSVVQAYGSITRSIFPATDNLDNPYQALCFPYWKTDYSMSPPPTPPPPFI